MTAKQTASKQAPPEKSQTFQSTIQVAGILVAAAMALAGLILSYQSLHKADATANKVDATRVEIGNLITNSNSPEFISPWQQWEGRLTDKSHLCRSL